MTLRYLLLCHSFVPHARTPRRSSRRPFYPDIRPSCHRTERCPTCSNLRRWNCRFYYYIRSRRHRRRSSRPGLPDLTVQTQRIGPPWCGQRPVFVHFRPLAATSLEHGPPASPYSCSLAWASVCCSSERGKIATCDLWLRRIIVRHTAKSSVHRSCAVLTGLYHHGGCSVWKSRAMSLIKWTDQFNVSNIVNKLK